MVCDLFMTDTDCWRKESTKSDMEPFNIQELESAARNIKCGRAPGPDKVSPEGIKQAAKASDKVSPEGIKQAAKASPVWLLKILNKILETQTFPEEWKIAKVILIPGRMEAPAGHYSCEGNPDSQNWKTI
ncbi:hypothetical protein QE152_g24271 [Popillia japonica]|uniref:RNA-directed DNA polymerase from mobile element jockey n=1 Tax=Popillia japonica TaxID=7064 RepID=A0AAW1KFL8_POPJA